MRRPGGLAALALLVSAAASAQPDEWSATPPPWEGVWSGTIGTLPVHVCLNNTPYQDNGAYYYDRHRALIALDLAEDRKSWSETSASGEAGGPRWVLANRGANQLAGMWSDGKRNLPIALKRIGDASKDFEGPCGSHDFHDPRLSKAAVAERDETFQGQPITRMTFKPGAPFDSVELKTFVLHRGGAAAAKINAELRKVLPDPDGGGDWFDCMMSNANAHGSDGEFSHEIEPTLIGPRWLAARESYGDYCGGAHPNDSIGFLTFDLTSGTKVDPLDWFLPSAVKAERYEGGDVSKTLTPAFEKALLAGYKPDDKECDGVLDDADYWTVGIDRGVLVFWPQLPRVVMACSEDFKLPFFKLAPWLNAKGKAAVATLPR